MSRSGYSRSATSPLAEEGRAANTLASILGINGTLPLRIVSSRSSGWNCLGGVPGLRLLRTSNLLLGEIVRTLDAALATGGTEVRF